MFTCHLKQIKSLSLRSDAPATVIGHNYKPTLNVESCFSLQIKHLGMGELQKVQSGSEAGTGDGAALLGTILFPSFWCSQHKLSIRHPLKTALQAWGKGVHPWVCNSAVHDL